MKTNERQNTRPPSQPTKNQILMVIEALLAVFSYFFLGWVGLGLRSSLVSYNLCMSSSLTKLGKSQTPQYTSHPANLIYYDRSFNHKSRGQIGPDWPRSWSWGLICPICGQFHPSEEKHEEACRQAPRRGGGPPNPMTRKSIPDTIETCTYSIASNAYYI